MAQHNSLAERNTLAVAQYNALAQWNAPPVAQYNALAQRNTVAVAQHNALAYSYAACDADPYSNPSGRSCRPASESLDTLACRGRRKCGHWRLHDYRQFIQESRHSWNGPIVAVSRVFQHRTFRSDFAAQGLG